MVLIKTHRITENSALSIDDGIVKTNDTLRSYMVTLSWRSIHKQFFQHNSNLMNISACSNPNGIIVHRCISMSSLMYEGLSVQAKCCIISGKEIIMYSYTYALPGNNCALCQHIISSARYMFLVASLMSHMASLVTTGRMQQYFNIFTDIQQVSLLLFHCCILLKIKLTTATHFNTAIATRFCTWHDSGAIVTYANVCCDIMTGMESEQNVISIAFELRRKNQW